MIIFPGYMFMQDCFFVLILVSRTRRRTTMETLANVHSSSTPIEILRRICEQCAISDVEYFDPVLCDGVIKKQRRFDLSRK